MNPSFNIQVANTDNYEVNLFLEIGLQGLSYIVTDDNNNALALAVYHFPADTTLERSAVYLKQVVSNQIILQGVYKKITIIYSYASAVLVPHEFMTDTVKNDLLNLQYGEIGEVIVRKDFVYQQSLHNIYTVPKQIEAVISYLFSADNCTHLYSVLPGIQKFSGNHLYSIFGSNSNLTVMLLKKGQLQIIQTFQYKTGEDVAYYLLQLCESFEVPVNDTIVHLNGMIDESSNLYQELYKYFLQLQFDTLPDDFNYPEEIKEHPSHYFSHLFAIAACV